MVSAATDAASRKWPCRIHQRWHEPRTAFNEVRVLRSRCCRTPCNLADRGTSLRVDITASTLNPVSSMNSSTGSRDLGRPGQTGTPFESLKNGPAEVAVNRLLCHESSGRSL